MDIVVMRRLSFTFSYIAGTMAMGKVSTSKTSRIRVIAGLFAKRGRCRQCSRGALRLAISIWQRRQANRPSQSNSRRPNVQRTAKSFGFARVRRMRHGTCSAVVSLLPISRDLVFPANTFARPVHKESNEWAIKAPIQRLNLITEPIGFSTSSYRREWIINSMAPMLFIECFKDSLCNWCSAPESLDKVVSKPKRSILLVPTRFITLGVPAGIWLTK